MEVKCKKTTHPLSPSESPLFPYFNERSELYFQCFFTQLLYFLNTQSIIITLVD
jgi:hypothetical protein